MGTPNLEYKNEDSKENDKEKWLSSSFAVCSSCFIVSYAVISDDYSITLQTHNLGDKTTNHR